MALVWFHMGMMKAGSTWLYTWMSAHPELAAPFDTFDVRKGKNPYFWNRDDPIGRPPTKTDRPKMTPDAYFKAVDSVPKAIDVTDSASYMPAAAIAALWREYSDILVTCTIRDPVEAMWSHLHRHGLTIDDAEQGRAPRQIANAKVAENLQRWRAGGFDPYLIAFERVVFDPISVLQTLARRLGVDPEWWGQHAEEVHKPVLASKPRPQTTIEDRMRMRALIENPNSIGDR